MEKTCNSNGNNSTNVLMNNNNFPPPYNNSVLQNPITIYERINYFFYSFLSFLFCGSPFGLVGMYYAERANDAFTDKKFEDYKQKNHVAKIMLILSCVIVIPLNILVIVLYMTL